MSQTGLIIVVSAPSGAGKSTILSAAGEKNSTMRFSVSATTRPPRQGERDGMDYHFKSKEDFEEMISNNRLIEWDEYCGNYYGTPREFIENSIREGFDVVLDITVKGALAMKEQYPESVLIFIVPPSFEELRRRIESRGTESPEMISKRLEQAKQELSFADKYDYIIVNDGLDKAVESLECVICAEKMKLNRNRDVLEKLGFKS